MNRGITVSLAALLAVVMAASAAQAQVGKSVTIVEANVATEAELAALPHMNAARAKALIDRKSTRLNSSH